MLNLHQEMSAYLNYCETQKALSAHTLKAYRIDMAQFLSCKSNMSISKTDLSDYIQHLHKTFKPKTVRRKIASLKAFVHHLYYQDIIDKNPFDKIDISFKEPLLLPRIIPEQLIRKILAALYENIKAAATEYERSAAIRNAAVIELLFATGARVSEICSLKAKDIDLDAKTVRIFGKGSKERIIQIENDDVLAILHRYKTLFSEYILPDGYFFLNNRKQRFSEQSVRIVIKHLETQINSDIHITPHMFRHSVATMLLEEDVDIRYIQKILGHSSITTTQIYTHVTSAKQREIIRTKHPRNKMHMNMKL